MVDLPLLSVPSLQQQMVGHRSANMTLEQLEALNAEQKARTVLVVQDPLPAITMLKWWRILSVWSKN